MYICIHIYIYIYKSVTSSIVQRSDRTSILSRVFDNPVVGASFNYPGSVGSEITGEVIGYRYAESPILGKILYIVINIPNFATQFYALACL